MIVTLKTPISSDRQKLYNTPLVKITYSPRIIKSQHIFVCTQRNVFIVKLFVACNINLKHTCGSSTKNNNKCHGGNVGIQGKEKTRKKGQYMIMVNS